MKSEKMEVSMSPAASNLPGPVPMDVQVSGVQATSDESQSFSAYRNSNCDHHKQEINKLINTPVPASSEDEIVYGQLIVLGYVVTSVDFYFRCLLSTMHVDVQDKWIPSWW